MRILLVDDLRLPGSDLSDARDHATLLRATGAVVRAVALEDARALEDALDRGRAAPQAVARADTDREGLALIRSLAHEGRYDLVLIAGASPIDSSVRAALPRGVPLRRWWTRVPAAPGWLVRLSAAREPRAIADPSPESRTDPAPGISGS